MRYFHHIKKEKTEGESISYENVILSMLTFLALAVTLVIIVNVL